jgi:twitching motility protein PilT
MMAFDGPPKIDSPAEPDREPKTNALFRTVMKYQGSDLHLKVNLPPMMRLNGLIRKMDAPPISGEQMEHLVDPILSPEVRKTFVETDGADFVHVVGGDESRFRVNILKQRRGIGLVARRVDQ